MEKIRKLLYFNFYITAYLYPCDMLSIAETMVVNTGNDFGQFLLFLYQNVYFRYSLELPLRGNSIEYPQYIFWCKK